MSLPLRVIDRAKPWPVELRRERVAPEAYDLWRNCSLAWPLWQPGERLAEDLSGHDLHGAFGAGLAATDWQVGDLGPALRFASAATDVITVADPADDLLDATAQLSIEVTLRFTAVAARQGIVGKYRPSTGLRSWLLFFEPPNLRFQVSSDGAAFEPVDSSSFTWAAGTLYHIVLVYDAGVTSLQVNGADVAMGDFGAQLAIFGGTQGLHVGQRVTAAGAYENAFGGDLVSLRIWRGRALAASERRYLWDDPQAMYRSALPLGIPVGLHIGTAGAGPWIDCGTVDPGVQSLLIPGLENGVSYDVRAITIDTTGNESASSTPVTETPVASSVSWRGVREIVTSRANPNLRNRLIP